MGTADVLEEALTLGDRSRVHEPGKLVEQVVGERWHDGRERTVRRAQPV